MGHAAVSSPTRIDPRIGAASVHARPCDADDPRPGSVRAGGVDHESGVIPAPVDGDDALTFRGDEAEGNRVGTGPAPDGRGPPRFASSRPQTARGRGRGGSGAKPSRASGERSRERRSGSRATVPAPACRRQERAQAWQSAGGPGLDRGQESKPAHAERGPVLGRRREVLDDPRCGARGPAPAARSSARPGSGAGERRPPRRSMPPPTRRGSRRAGWFASGRRPFAPLTVRPNGAARRAEVCCLGGLASPPPQGPAALRPTDASRPRSHTSKALSRSAPFRPSRNEGAWITATWQPPGRDGHPSNRTGEDPAMSLPLEQVETLRVGAVTSVSAVVIEEVSHARRVKLDPVPRHEAGERDHHPSQSGGDGEPMGGAAGSVPDRFPCGPRPH